MKGFVRKLHLSFPHVAQWLVRTTDDRVVAGSNPRAVTLPLETDSVSDTD